MQANPNKHTPDEAGDLFRAIPPCRPAHATQTLSDSVCLEVRDRACTLMRGAGRRQHPPVRWSARLESLVQVEIDTTYGFPKKGAGGSLTAPFVKNLLHPFLRTLVAGQGLQDDARDYIQQHRPLRPPESRQEARAAVESVGFAPIALGHIVPAVLNLMFVAHVRAPPEDRHL